MRFAALKGEDAARTKVLRAAAMRAGCSVHLGIVHIEETGPAEPHYDGGHGYRGRGRGRSYYEDATEEDVGSGDFEVIEVSDSSRYIDQWTDEQDRPVAYGALPLEEDEVLPGGALDDEEPDEQRLLEATGNEGASFERSYHRAALVLWPRDRFASVLLQAGVGAALPHLAERLAAGDQAATSVAEKIIEAWEEPQGPWRYGSAVAEPSRAEMLRLLAQLGDHTLQQRFIESVVAREFDGSEIEQLAVALHGLGAKNAGKLLSVLARENFSLFPGACVNLLSHVLDRLGEQRLGHDPCHGARRFTPDAGLHQDPTHLSASVRAAPSRRDLHGGSAECDAANAHAAWRTGRPTGGREGAQTHHLNQYSKVAD